MDKQQQLSSETKPLDTNAPQSPEPPPAYQRQSSSLHSLVVSNWFRIKKWTLLGMMGIDVGMLLAYSIFAGQLAERAITHLDNVKPDQYGRIKTTTTVIIVFTSVVLICLQLWFMFGVYRERVGLVTAYTVISVLATMVALIQALSEPFYWIVALWAALITALVALFLRDLNQRHQEEKRRRRRKNIDKELFGSRSRSRSVLVGKKQRLSSV